MSKNKRPRRSGTRRRDYKAEYRRRQQRARELGFPSYSQQRKAHRPKRTADLKALPEEARRSRTRALSAVARARVSGSSLSGKRRGSTALWRLSASGRQKQLLVAAGARATRPEPTGSFACVRSLLRAS